VSLFTSNLAYILSSPSRGGVVVNRSKTRANFCLKLLGGREKWRGVELFGGAAQTTFGALVEPNFIKISPPCASTRVRVLLL
jgi:hypothetical protein